MAIISTTATFVPEITLWETPMRPNNTPVTPGSPIGKVTWFSSVNIPAKITTNTEELTVTLNTISNYALRFTDITWDAQVTDADSQADLNDLEDQALITIPTTERTLSFPIGKESVAVAFNLTNQFSLCKYRAGANNMVGYDYSTPFLPTTPMVFRVVNESGNAAAATSLTSNMTALIYTVEQYNSLAIWRTQSVT